MALDMLSSVDISLLSMVACGATAYVAQSYLQQVLHPPQEPLIPPLKAIGSDGTKKVLLQPSRNVLKALKQAKKNCVVFYGSQTGTAERLAYQFSKEAQTKFGIQCLVADLEDFDFEDLLSLPNDKAAIFMVATYGDGEATDNAIGFEQYLHKLNEAAQYANTTLSYAAFGLGNSSYQYYNEMVKRVDSTMLQHQAHRLGNVGFGDDGRGSLDEDFTEWKDDVLPQLAEHFNLLETPYRYEASFQMSTKLHGLTIDTFLGEPNKRHLRGKFRGPYTLTNPYPAPVTNAHDLCANSSRQILHMELSLVGSTLTYEAGDHLVVRPINCDLEVDRFLRVFGLDDKRNEEIAIISLDSGIKVPIPTPTTYEAAARYYLDICGPVSRRCLATFATFAPTNSGESRLLRFSNRAEEFKREVSDACLNISQVLEMCESMEPWSKVPFSVVLENIVVMKPRYYSISSSSLVSRKTVSITAVIESKPSNGPNPAFKGVATNFILALAARFQAQQQLKPVCVITTHKVEGPRQQWLKPTLLVNIRRSNFKLPRDASVPIIMVGPGTGVAPFRGFVQSRAQHCAEGKPVGRTVLFYGCRRSDDDFLYRSEWESYKTAMTSDVFSMHVAFSREHGKPKRYVQHLLDEHTLELQELILHRRAYFYVCGDAQRMARDVFKTMIQILAGSEHFQGDSIAAEKYVVDMKAERRWLEDVW